jgi:hypothetical protein
LERANEVARQIEVLLTGLAKRAETAGLAALAEQLRSVAGEAAREARGGGPRNSASAGSHSRNE